jgi:gliding motility-associated-like protein
VAENTLEPQLSIAEPDTLNCSQENLQLDATTDVLNFQANWSTLDGNIVSGAQGLTPVVDEAGTYQLVIENLDNGCSTTSNIEVDAILTVPVADAGPPGLLTCDQTSIVLDGTNSSGAADLIFEWTTMNGNIVSGSSSAMPEVDGAGEYLLTVIHPLSECTASSTVLVNQDQELPLVNAGPDQVFGCGDSTLVLSGTSNNNDLIFEWSTLDGTIDGNLNQEDVIVSSSGTYNLQVIDTLNGCASMDQVVVTEDFNTPVITAGPDQELTCDVNSVVLEATPGGNIAQFVFEWQTDQGNIVSGGNTLMPTVDAAGDYTLVVTDTTNGCFAETVVVVIQDSDVPVAQVLPDGQLNCVNQSITLDGLNSSQGPSIDFEWATTDGHFVSGDNTLTPVVDAAGTYVLTITDLSNDCVSTASIVLEPDTLSPELSIPVPAVLTCTETEVELEGALLNGGTTNTFSWSTSDGLLTGPTDGLQTTAGAPGSYLLLVQNNDNGCISESTIIVTEDVELPEVFIDGPQAINCDQLTVNLNAQVDTGTDPNSFFWSTTSGQILSGAFSLTPQVGASGFYILEVENLENSCVQTDSVFVAVDTLAPQVEAGMPVNLNCSNSIQALDGTGSITTGNQTYQWNTLNGNILSGQNSLMPLVDASGTYFLEITDLNNGCQASDSVTVNEDFELPFVNAGPGQQIDCLTPEVILSGTATGGNQLAIVWTTTDGNILSGQDGTSPLVDAPGTYQLTVVNQVNGCLASSTVVVTENVDFPDILIADPDMITCLIPSVQLDGTGSDQGPGFDVSWNTQDGLILTGAGTLSPEVGSAGTYELVIVNQNSGCESTESITVEEALDVPEGTLEASGILTCVTEEVDLQGQITTDPTNVVFSWGTVQGVYTSNTNTLQPQVGATGLYWLILEDQLSGCADTLEVTVEEEVTVPQISVLPPDLITCILEEVELVGSASGYSTDFDFEWITLNGAIGSDPDSSTITALQSGDYTIFVTDPLNGCSDELTVTVDENTELPEVEAGEDVSLPCGVDEWSLNATVNNAGSNPTIIWSTDVGAVVSGNSNTTPLVSGPGQYWLTVTNTANGCFSADTLMIDLAESMEAILESVQPDCEITEGSIEIVEVVGGEMPYQYSIDGGLDFQSSAFFDNVAPGTYDVLVQDPNGCESQVETVVIESVSIPEVEPVDDIELDNGESTQVELLLNIPTTDILSVSWSPSGGLSCTDCLNPEIAPEEDTDYTVTITSQDGCSTSLIVRVLVDQKGGIYLPNAFSPNGDGNNEIFFLSASPGAINIIRSFLVFDRWGEPIWQYYNIQPNDPQYGWDGRYRGQILNTGVYTWFAEIELPNGRIEVLKGDVLLMR